MVWTSHAIHDSIPTFNRSYRNYWIIDCVVVRTVTREHAAAREERRVLRDRPDRSAYRAYRDLQGSAFLVRPGPQARELPDRQDPPDPQE